MLGATVQGSIGDGLPWLSLLFTVTGLSVPLPTQGRHVPLLALPARWPPNLVPLLKGRGPLGHPIGIRGWYTPEPAHLLTLGSQGLPNMRTGMSFPPPCTCEMGVLREGREGGGGF